MRNLKTVIILTVDEAKLDIAKNFAQMVYESPELLLEANPIPRFNNMSPREVADLHGELNLGEQYMFVLYPDDTGRVRDNLQLVLVQVSDYEYVTSWDVKNKEPEDNPVIILTPVK